MGVPNQRIIYIKRTTDTDRANYFKVGNDNLRKAASTLDGKAFKLWVYLSDNANGYKKEMYAVDFCDWANLSDSSYRRAWNELEDNGYIIKHKKEKNIYMFNEVGKNEASDIVKVLTEEELKEMECFFVQSDSQIDNQND